MIIIKQITNQNGVSSTQTRYNILSESAFWISMFRAIVAKNLDVATFQLLVRILKQKKKNSTQQYYFINGRKSHYHYLMFLVVYIKHTLQ
jgi:hypothetical protein